MSSNTNEESIQEKIKRYSDPRVAGLLVFGVMVLLVTWSGLQVMQRNYELQRKEAELRQKNENQKLINENLKFENVYLETDQYIELTARRQFNKAAAGEKLYLIPEEVALSKTVEMPKTEKNESDAEKQKSKYVKNFEAWLNFLFK